MIEIFIASIFILLPSLLVVNEWGISNSYTVDLLRNRLEGHQIDDCSNEIDSYSESISSMVSVFGREDPKDFYFSIYMLNYGNYSVGKKVSDRKIYQNVEKPLLVSVFSGIN